MAFSMSYGEPPAAAVKPATDAPPAKRAKRSTPARKPRPSADQPAASGSPDIKDEPPV